MNRGRFPLLCLTLMVSLMVLKGTDLCWEMEYFNEDKCAAIRSPLSLGSVSRLVGQRFTSSTPGYKKCSEVWRKRGSFLLTHVSPAAIHLMQIGFRLASCCKYQIKMDFT